LKRSVFFHKINVDTLGDNSSTFSETLKFHTQFDIIALQDVARSEHCKLDITEQLRKSWTTSFISTDTTQPNSNTPLESPFIYTWHNASSAPTARSTETAPYHGGMIAIRAPYSRLVRETINDPRGWGRFGGVLIGNPRYCYHFCICNW